MISTCSPSSADAMEGGADDDAFLGSNVASTLSVASRPGGGPVHAGIDCLWRVEATGAGFLSSVSSMGVSSFRIRSSQVSIKNAVKELSPDMAFLGVSEEVPGTGGKVLAFAVVPDAVTTSSGLEAQEWVLAALQGCNGRGGGRSGTAQAQAPSCNDVSEV
jgi:hypothetical protein